MCPVMRRRWFGLVSALAARAVLLALAAVPAATAQTPSGPVRAIAAMDLNRYAGRWHEVARLPNWFQRRCVADVIATYEPRANGITVVNECRTADGKQIRAEGRARLADPAGPASRLKVRFAPAVLSFIPAVWADYWVLDLTDDYRVALVGTPDRKYLWVLARQPALDQATFDRMLATAARQGFDVSRLHRATAP